MCALHWPTFQPPYFSIHYVWAYPWLARPSHDWSTWMQDEDTAHAIARFLAENVRLVCNLCPQCNGHSIGVVAIRFNTLNPGGHWWNSIGQWAPIEPPFPPIE